MNVLGERALNRALLARQHLLRPAAVTVPSLVEHLVGLQAQAANAPYLGLWTRLEEFRLGQLTELIHDRRVVRSALMRGTLHHATAEDYLAFRPVLAPVLQRAVASVYGKEMAGIDPADLAAAARDALAARPLTIAELGSVLRERWPGPSEHALTQTVRALVPLIHVPPDGTWDRHKSPKLATAEDWLGRPLDPDPSPDALVLRYLAAFGPATIADVNHWCGLTAVREVIDRLRDRLCGFTDERGRELFDLPDAPRPDMDVPAPLRLVPDFDNLLLSHADRTRIIADEYRKVVFTVNGQIRATVLVDGMVRGMWKLTRRRQAATITVTPFIPFPKAVRDGVAAEAQRLLAVAADGETHDIQFAPA